MNFSQTAIVPSVIQSLPSLNDTRSSVSTAVIAPLTSPLFRSSSLVFVDATLPDAQILTAGTTPGAEVHLLSPTQDAISQITQTLAGRSDITSLHIVSHGTAGALDFGGGLLNLANLPTYTSQLKSWGKSLSDDADILLYGCDVAEGELGRAFVKILSQLTGADVAASNDLTGSANQGGDWSLEIHTGEIAAGLAFQSDVMKNYSAVLNVAPDLSGDATLTAINEDLTNPAGTTVSTLFDPVFDDFDAGDILAGVAVIGDESLSTQGIWQYSTDNGANWFEIGAVDDDATALALSKDTLVRFLPALNYNGIPDSIEVRAIDNSYTGGFTNGSNRITIDTELNGDETPISDTTSFVDTEVFSVNDAPSFTKGSDITVSEDSEDTFFTNWATDISPGANDEFEQTLSFELTADKPELFTVAPEIDKSGNLSFELAEGANGNATVTVKLRDDGGTENSGVDLSAAQTFTITITASEDRPVLTGDAVLAAINEDSLNANGASLLSLFGKLIDDPDPTNSLKGLAIIGNGADAATEGRWEYSANNGANWSEIGDVNDGSNALALAADTLVRFVPVANYNGTPGALRARALDDTFSGNLTSSTTRVNVDTGSIGSDRSISETTSALTTTINSVNDVPVFTKGNAITVRGNTSQFFSGWATNISAGAPNETDQVLNFEVSADKPGLFEVAPSLDSTGNLSFKPKEYARGTTLVTVRLKDNSGIANGGVDISASQTFVISLNLSNQPDFNQDGSPDILWRNATSGANVIWQLNGTAYSTAASLPTLTGNWVLEGINDFNQDGSPDILWRNATSGDNVIWQLNGTAYSKATSLPKLAGNWVLEGINDFNQDGSPDILWRNATSGDNVIWQLNGTAYSTATLLPKLTGSWMLEGISDFNHDGSPDILWRNATTGDNVIWQLNGTAYSTATFLPKLTGNWVLEGINDFSSDGSPDVLWRNTTTGANVIWQLNGIAYSTATALPMLAGSWMIEEISDFSGDGSPDVLWRNTTTGANVIWQLNGIAYSTATALPTLAGSWMIA
ncbi:DUF4347 domain-containing protein [Kovacikia minuta CCNUW1]|uniref:DUF4347 domain-containing protein n=1 Tax=Kovacikia minuta TaxID=2931930 RepID=UPI001CCA7BE7|nr:DUF4347 domain-containing protein [Kovacikia minuta]UBF28092.1 DUF4347 domain-containing protein [Kovacikia minuta CCNUW1]